MLKTIGKRANFARWRESGIALGIALGIVLSVVAPIRDVRAAEGDRTVRMAKFARPATVPFPSENPYSPDKAELGRKLFFDPLMSASGTISCATCHHPRVAWGDGLPSQISSTKWDGFGNRRNRRLAVHTSIGAGLLRQNRRNWT